MCVITTYKLVINYKEENDNVIGEKLSLGISSDTISNGAGAACLDKLDTEKVILASLTFFWKMLNLDVAISKHQTHMLKDA